MTRAVVFFLILLSILSGCRKPDPTPHLRDPIYKDIEERIKELDGLIATEKGQAKEAQDAMSKAVPQTGQIKFAKKHYFDAVARLEKLEQIKRFYELRKKSREEEALQEYLSYYDQQKEEEWPPASSLSDYRARETARTKPKNWNVKKRIQEEASRSQTSGGGGTTGAAGGH